MDELVSVLDHSLHDLPKFVSVEVLKPNKTLNANKDKTMQLSKIPMNSDKRLIQLKIWTMMLRSRLSYLKILLEQMSISNNNFRAMFIVV